MPAPPPPPLLFTLNDPALVFIPSATALSTDNSNPKHSHGEHGAHSTRVFEQEGGSWSQCYFTSVYVYTCDSEHQRRREIDVGAAYTNFQLEISKLLSHLVLQHLHSPFPPHVRSFLIDGAAYSLRCDLKPWPYGETLELSWGTTRLVPMGEKWQVGFRVVQS